MNIKNDSTKENCFDCSETGYKYENILISISIVCTFLPT